MRTGGILRDSSILQVPANVFTDIRIQHAEKLELCPFVLHLISIVLCVAPSANMYPASLRFALHVDMRNGKRQYEYSLKYADHDTQTNISWHLSLYGQESFVFIFKFFY